MFKNDDPTLLLGRDHESVVTMIADASMRADPLQLAEARAMFALVSSRASTMLPPTSARLTASLILGPVAALARTVEDIDAALSVTHDWLATRPTCTLRALGAKLAPLDDLHEQAGRMDIADQDETVSDPAAGWEEAFHEASVLVMMGGEPCRVVACGDMLQIRIQDPETGWYLTLAHIPFDPDEDREGVDPVPELVA